MEPWHQTHWGSRGRIKEFTRRYGVSVCKCRIRRVSRTGTQESSSKVHIRVRSTVGEQYSAPHTPRKPERPHLNSFGVDSMFTIPVGAKQSATIKYLPPTPLIGLGCWETEVRQKKCLVHESPADGKEGLEVSLPHHRPVLPLDHTVRAHNYTVSILTS